MHRIYLPDLVDLHRDSREITIGGHEARYGRQVKRLSAGEPVELFNGAGAVASGVISRVESRSLTVQVADARHVAPQRVLLTIAAPIPKGQRPEWLVDQLSQIGVSRWQPIMTERSVVNSRASRLEKWRRVTAVESARQCGRAHLLEIGQTIVLEEFIDALPASDHALILASADGSVDWPVDEGDVGALTIVVGPEGGLAGAEHDLLVGHDARCVWLGPHTLRTETACVAAAARAIGRVGLNL